MGNQYISGPQPQGTRGNNVSFIYVYDRDPTPYDVQGFFLLDWWLNKEREAVWVLVSREGNSTSMGPLAHWVELTAGGSGTVIGLRDQAGNPVNADVNGYINVIGDNTYIQTVANAGTHTLTINLANPTTYVKTLTGNNNTEHVGPIGGDIQVIGDTTTIDIQGDAGTHTLTASVIKGGTVLWTLTGDDSVVVTPLAGNIDVKATIYSGSTLQFEGSTPNTLNLQVTDISDNILIGFGAGNATLVGTGALNNVGTGVLVGHSLNAGHDNSMYGWEAGNHIDDGNLNSLFGSGAGAKITSGNENTAISTALTNLTTGSSNIAIGSGAGSALTTEDDCVLIAHAGIAGSPGLVALSIPNVTHFMHNFGNNNTFLGNAAGNFTLTASFSTGLGANALNGATTGDFNTAVGNSSQSVVDVGSGNSSLGDSSLIALRGGDNNTVAGQGAANQLVGGSNNLILGKDSGTAYTANESSNLLLSNSGVAAENNVCRLGTDGNGAGQQNVTYMAGDVHMPHNLYLDASTAAAATCPIIYVGTSGNWLNFCENSVFIGNGAGNLTFTSGVALFNVAVGPLTMPNVRAGQRNMALGNGALTTLRDGQSNVCIGYVAGSSIQDTNFNTFIGSDSGQNSVGRDNVGIGFYSLQGATTGSWNSCFGSNAGALLATTESSNIMINNTGTVGDNNTCRIGAGTGAGNQQLNRCFISGIRGITTGVADALPVLVDSADQLGTISSSRKYKENIHDLGNQSEIIYDLRPVAFNFKNDPLKTPAWGLIAEEVDAVFPRLAVYGKHGEPESVKYHDLPVLLLNEIKKLRARIEVLEATCYTKKDS